MKVQIQMTINRQRYDALVDPGESLINVLRRELGLTGSKVSCDDGDCGACTVIVDGQAVKGCIYPAARANGKTLLTIEGLAGEEMHPLQTKFIELAAVQCGYCIPGMILAAKAYLDENPNPTLEETREAIGGNICRCTGYTKPVQAIMEAAKVLRGE